MNGKIPDDVLNKKLYLKVKNELKSKIKNRQWGVYDSARLVREYKKRGGKYKLTKKEFGIDRWFKEVWIDACTWLKNKSIEPCGRSNKNQKIKYCRPLIRVSEKTPKTVKELSTRELKKRCETKQRIIR